ncbi:MULTISPECIES: outer membrane protein assembly factor BamB family protein [Streptomycetaceae]|uniref:outer membrane protein assembly factor BamB family protein n=1 Tax=Streptomycetaceae TaxID=2062 RepID=UPI0004092CD6|nr:PQQ-binding-like beta-propeller repeat protein [Streptantibioticus cattleyicolor]
MVTKDGAVRAIGRADARVRWTVRTPVGVHTDPGPVGATAPGRLVVSTRKGAVAAFDTADGRTVWTLPHQSDSLVRPTVDGGTVYVSGTSLTVRRAADGKELWTAHGEDAAYHQPVSCGPPTVLAAFGAWPWKLKAATGQELWASHAPGGAVGAGRRRQERDRPRHRRRRRRPADLDLPPPRGRPPLADRRRQPGVRDVRRPAAGAAGVLVPRRSGSAR